MAIRVWLNITRQTQSIVGTIDEEGGALLERIDRLSEATISKPSGVFGGLGYRGFLVERSSAAPEGPLSLYIHEGIVDKGQAQINAVDGDQTVERTLLESGRGRNLIDDGLYKYIAQEMSTRATLGSLLQGVGIAPAGCPIASCRCPPYNPGKWNIPTVQPHNNCYNYGNDHITNTFAQPGRAHGKPIPSLTCLRATFCDCRWFSFSEWLWLATRSRKGMVRRPSDLARPRLPLVSPGQCRVLVSQTGANGCAERRQ